MPWLKGKQSAETGQTHHRITEVYGHNQAIPSIVKALFGVGDKLIRAADEDVGFFNRGNDARVTLLIEKLIPRLDPSDRYTVLKEGIENGQAVYIIVDVTTWLGVEHGRLEREPLPEDMRTV